MSMSSCPGCQTENEMDDSNKASEIQCCNLDCKMWYQRIVEMGALQEDPIAVLKIQLGKLGQKATPALFREISKQLEEDDENEDEIYQFRRVHVVHKNPVATSQLLHVRRDDSVTMRFDEQHDRRYQQTSSYWTVIEQNTFPELLQHFGTDWRAIAKFMGAKTHVMVKNYFLRQVQSGRMSEWEQIARDADEKNARGESTGILETPLPGEPILGLISKDQRHIVKALNFQHARLTPPMQDSISQRSGMAAHEAHLERLQALRIEREAQAQRPRAQRGEQEDRLSSAESRRPTKRKLDLEANPEIHGLRRIRRASAAAAGIVTVE